MKTIAALVFMSVFLFGLTGCARNVEEQAPEHPTVATPQESAAVTNNPEVPPFSYEAVRTQFAEGTPGVKTGGFRNVA